MQFNSNTRVLNVLNSISRNVCQALLAGKWSFTCREFEGFVGGFVGGMAKHPRFVCLGEEGFTPEGYEVRRCRINR